MKKNVVFITLLCSVFVAPVFADNDKGMTWGFRHMSFDNSLHQGGMESAPHNNNLPTNRTSAGNSYQKKIVMVGCNSATDKANVRHNNIPGFCNAYQGDTKCTAKRPILCVKKSANYKNRPPYAITTNSHSMTKEFYSGWVGYPIKLTNPVRGNQLTSRAAADQKCGNGWVMAEFHDGLWIKGMNENNLFKDSWNKNAARSGGWSFHAKFNGINNPNKRNRLKKTRFWVASNTTKANCWDQ